MLGPGLSRMVNIFSERDGVTSGLYLITVLVVGLWLGSYLLSKLSRRVGSGTIQFNARCPGGICRKDCCEDLPQWALLPVYNVAVGGQRAPHTA